MFAEHKLLGDVTYLVVNPIYLPSHLAPSLSNSCIYNMPVSLVDLEVMSAAAKMLFEKCCRGFVVHRSSAATAGHGIG